MTMTTQKIIPNFVIPSATVWGNLCYHRKQIHKTPAKSSQKHTGISATSRSAMQIGYAEIHIFLILQKFHLKEKVYHSDVLFPAHGHAVI
jgi:hypothetical protein